MGGSAAAAMTAMRSKADVTMALRDAILAGRLMPNERLVEVELAARFGTSRAQVRTALLALEGEGLVVSEPNRGARVRHVTAEEALEIVEARGALEVMATGKAAERATAEDVARLQAILARMREKIEAGDLIGYSSMNGEFHGEVRRIARHATSAKLLHLLNSQIIRYQFRSILIPGRAARSFAEHGEIVAAIAAQDAARARETMARHLVEVVDNLRLAIAAQGLD